MKANATLSGHAVARNPLFPPANGHGPTDSGLVHPGLVAHALVSPGVQVQILSVIDATGSASIGDIIAELPGHEDPVGAIFALIAAGVLMIVSPGIIDAHSTVARTTGSGPQGGKPVEGGHLTGTEATDAAMGDGVEVTGTGDARPIDFASFAATPLPDGLHWVATAGLQPCIIIGAGSRRAAFRHVELLHQTGVYLLLRGRDVYVGYGADVAVRATSGRQMPGGTPEAIIGIVEAQNRFTDDDARALERILWNHVAADPDSSVINGVPDGAAVDPARYSQLMLVAAEVVLALRQAGLMFLGGSARAQIAGPRSEPDRLGAPRRIDDVPEGRIRELNYCGLTAVAAERDDGNWLLLRGSDVRIATVSSASSSASFLRAAWLHAGIIELGPDGTSYVLKRDMLFSSGSAVGHFVSGSKGFGPSAWALIDSDDTEDTALALAS